MGKRTANQSKTKFSTGASAESIINITIISSTLNESIDSISQSAEVVFQLRKGVCYVRQIGKGTDIRTARSDRPVQTASRVPVNQDGR